LDHYHHLLEYIRYFEQEGQEYGKCTFPPNTLPYMDYGDKLMSFIRCISESDLMKTDYLEYINVSTSAKVTEQIENADMELLKAIFTYYNRQERFVEGLWAVAARDKIFLRLLYRLKTLCCFSD
jgi:hypothetical protein